MNGFFQKDYKIPQGDKPYTKFDQGDTRLRILSNPIMGNEYWIETTDDKGKERPQPVRSKMDEEIDIANVPEPDKVRHFWAMVIWNYNTSRLEILLMTQKTIMKRIKSLDSNEVWGSPKGTDGYDLVVTRTGSTMQDTEYEVTANPKAKLDKAIVEKYELSDIYLEALFNNSDPFEGTPIDTKKIK